MARYNEEALRPRPSIAKFASWVNPVSGDEAEDVKVRKAVAADAEVICGFLKDMRDEQARKRPDIVSRDEDILSLEEVLAAIEDETKLVFVAENGDGKVLGQILCELEGTEETVNEVSELLLGEVGAVAEPAAEAVEEAAEVVAEAAEPVVEAVEEAAEAVAEAAEPVVEAVEEAAEVVTEAAEPAAEAVEEVVESAAEAADPVPAALDPVPDEPEEAAPVKKAFTAKKLIIANIYVTDDARRQRIGTELYREACSEAKKLGCTGAELSCWQFDKDGIIFFEKQGYKSLLVTMEKSLG